MKYTNVGGQAVIEGVMMKSETKIAMCVNDPRGERQLVLKAYTAKSKINRFYALPIIRGCVNFFEMMVLGVAMLNCSAEISFDEPEKNGGKSDTSSKMLSLAGALIGILAAVALFIILPAFIASFFRRVTSDPLLINLIEGVIRVCVFVLYLVAMNLSKDMRRMFMYHGAEHKVIACYEHGKDLNVANARKYSRLHPRCGTTFLFIVMIVSILIFSLTVWSSNIIVRTGLKILLLPIVAGVSYEALKFFAKRDDNKLCAALEKPGISLQRLTTKEPDDSMLEAAIVAFEAAILSDKELSSWRESGFGLDYSLYSKKDSSV